jgi:hypothetical protein
MELNSVSPYVSADVYRIGQHDGFKAGLAAGVVGMLVIKAVRNSRKKGEPKKDWKTFWTVN